MKTVKKSKWYASPLFWGGLVFTIAILAFLTIAVFTGGLASPLLTSVGIFALAKLGIGTSIATGSAIITAISSAIHVSASLVFGFFASAFVFAVNKIWFNKAMSVDETKTSSLEKTNNSTTTTCRNINNNTKAPTSSKNHSHSSDISDINTNPKFRNTCPIFVSYFFRPKSNPSDTNNDQQFPFTLPPLKNH